ELAQVAKAAGAQVTTYGLKTDADWSAEQIAFSPAGVDFTLISRYGKARVNPRLVGEVNVLNLLAALAAAHARGVPFEQLVGAVPTLRAVAGRFQPVDAGQPFTVIVDYAHTDDALRNLTALARQLVAGSQTSYS